MKRSLLLMLLLFIGCGPQPQAVISVGETVAERMVVTDGWVVLTPNESAWVFTQRYTTAGEPMTDPLTSSQWQIRIECKTYR